MITNKDLEIANTSYVNKDFATIYPELLDLVKQLTDKWDASTSNESDPGVVLLKLLAFIADKNNYNTDKNILEAFLPSATQYASVREICETNGYTVGYYNSATTNITITYTGTSSLEEAKNFNKFDTSFTNEDGTITYSLLDNVNFGIGTEGGQSINATAIEGTITSLVIGDSDVITLSNLDDFNRLYLPETMIAENGIFIFNNDAYDTSGYNAELWTKVDNLNIQPLGRKVFKFGYSSSHSAPYIEFPNDIINLIGSGLKVKYTITSGLNGVIKANVLTNIATISEEESEIYSVTNTSASIGASDIETINEAYNNFKHIIGTFDTLVSVRDYENYLYNFTEDNGTHLVSNVKVTDRTNDINRTVNVTSYNDAGQSSIVKVIGNRDVLPFDLYVYPLNYAPTITNYSEFFTTFLPVDNVSILESTLNEEVNNESVKAVCHNFYGVNSDGNFEDISLIQNRYKITATISTFSKVNKEEQDEIIANVKQAIYNNFNSRQLEYGQEIPFDTLYNVILKSDNRIKSISLSEPIYKPYLITGTSASNYREISLLDNSDSYVDYLAKNVLSGRVGLFDYNIDFVLDYGQANIVKLDNIKTISTSFKHTFNSSQEVTTDESTITKQGEAYTLKDNEVLQIIRPNLQTLVQYSGTVRYVLNGFTADISANTDYVIKDNQSISITYFVDDVEYHDEITAGEIVNSTETLKHDFEGASIDRGYNLTGSTAVVTIKGVRQISINNRVIYIYWVMNNTANSLFNNYYLENIVEGNDSAVGDCYVILGDRDYFIYKASEDGAISIFTSGTKVILKNVTLVKNGDNWAVPENVLNSYIFSDPIDINKIIEDGNIAIPNNRWRRLANTSSPIIVQEMEINTFFSGSVVSFEGDKELSVDNTFQSLTSTMRVNGTSYSYNENSGNYNWQIRSRLDLNSGPTTLQTVQEGQSITYELADGTESKSIEKGTSFYSNIDVSLAGGDNLDMTLIVLDSNSSTGLSEEYSLDFYTFKQVPTYYLQYAVPVPDGETSQYYNRVDNGNLIVSITEHTKSVILPLSIEKGVEGDFKEVIVPIYITGLASLPEDSTNTLTVTLGSVTQYDEKSTSEPAFSNFSEGANYKMGIKGTDTFVKNSAPLKIDNAINTKQKLATYLLYIKCYATNTQGITCLKIDLPKLSNSTGINCNLEIGYPQQVEGLNPVLGDLSSSASNDLLDKIKELGGQDFYYIQTIDNASSVDCVNMSDALALWDVNNIYNSFTLATFDENNSVIQIARSSRK